MIRIVTRLAVAPKNRRKVAEKASELVRLFEKHGLKSEGVFENFAQIAVLMLAWLIVLLAFFILAMSSLTLCPSQ